MTCISSITVTPSTVTLKKGEWYYNASAVACPADADCKSVSWHSNNTSVATVNATSGYIYAKAAGTAKIYACSTDGSGKSDYITVTVLNTVPVCSVTVNPKSISLEKDQCCTLSATVCPTNASNKALYWTSNNPNVANVDNGVVCALSGGTATIKAIAADGTGVFDTCVVTVTEDVLVTSITVEPNQKYMNIGESDYLEAEIYPENATNKRVIWSSNKPNIVTVNPESGLICALDSGSAVIYATAADGSGASDYCPVVVRVPVLAESITSKNENMTIIAGARAFADVIVAPSNTTEKVIWTSSNDEIASVGAYTGLVTGVAPGKVTITATIGNGLKATTEVTVVYEDIIIMRDGETNNRIIFNKSNKVWYCINRDMINDLDATSDTELLHRFCNNAYTYWVDMGGGGIIWEDLKTYTDDELRLIYAFDPHGMAKYVQEYASNRHSPGDGIQERLSKTLEYKDRIFKLLYNQSPKYYARISEGVWYETSDKSDLTKVISDSEYIFGFHPIYDNTTYLQIALLAIDCIASVASAAVPTAQIGNITTQQLITISKSIIKSFVKILYKQEPFNLETVTSDVTEFLAGGVDMLPDYNLGWANELLSISDSFGATAQALANKPHDYSEKLSFCFNSLNKYRIYFKFNNNEIVNIEEMLEALT